MITIQQPEIEDILADLFEMADNGEIPEEVAVAIGAELLFGPEPTEEDE
jgi:hypothetical protein